MVGICRPELCCAHTIIAGMDSARIATATRSGRARRRTTCRRSGASRNQVAVSVTDGGTPNELWHWDRWYRFGPCGHGSVHD